MYFMERRNFRVKCLRAPRPLELVTKLLRLRMFPAGKFGHNQLDWGPDGQEINALYTGQMANQAMLHRALAYSKRPHAFNYGYLGALLVSGEVIAETPGNAFTLMGRPT